MKELQISDFHDGQPGWKKQDFWCPTGELNEWEPRIEDIEVNYEDFHSELAQENQMKMSGFEKQVYQIDFNVLKFAENVLRSTQV